MKRLRNLGLVAILVFVISHFLPAYLQGSGFTCFAVCWKGLLGHDIEMFSGPWFYYSGFAISNILFIGLAAALFLTKKGRAFRLIVSVIFFLHVLSWLALHIFQHPSQVIEIKIGYYLWLVAYGLLVAAHLEKDPTELTGSIPVAQPVG